MKFIKTLFISLTILAIPYLSYACRFWVATGDGASVNAIDHLLLQPNSLKNLGSEYKDGWSIGYYEDDRPVILRGASASNVDKEFDQSVVNASNKSSDIVFAHLRRASSGCVEGIPNPHPFEIEVNGKIWIFGHNGGIKKQILFDLIGEDYLKNNPPAVCSESAPDSWIDSELYFIYLMKSIAAYDWNVELGIYHSLLSLYHEIPEEDRYFNFFLTDGNTVWAYRKGNSLYYMFDQYNKRSFVSSTIPHEESGRWKEVPEHTLLILNPNDEIKFKDIVDVSIDQTR